MNLLENQKKVTKSWKDFFQAHQFLNNQGKSNFFFPRIFPTEEHKVINELSKRKQPCKHDVTHSTSEISRVDRLKRLRKDHPACLRSCRSKNRVDRRREVFFFQIKRTSSTYFGKIFAKVWGVWNNEVEFSPHESSKFKGVSARSIRSFRKFSSYRRVCFSFRKNPDLFNRQEFAR